MNLLSRTHVVGLILGDGSGGCGGGSGGCEDGDSDHDDDDIWWLWDGRGKVGMERGRR